MNTDQLFSKLTISLHATMLSISNLLIHVPNTAHHIYYHTQDHIQLQHSGGWTRSRELQRATKINYAKSVF